MNKVFAILLLMISGAVAAYDVEWKPNEMLVGKLDSDVVKRGDTFDKIARRNGVGWNALEAANPSVDPEHLSENTMMVIPHLYMLPPVEWTGIVVNLAEKRLYYFHPNSRTVTIYPIGVGRVGWDTPTGVMKIVEKKHKPIWVVPDSILKWRKEHGDPLPARVLPGPDNPLGEHALRLSKPNFLLHGTNAPWGVGARSSAGCLRLYPEHIKVLYEKVPLRTQVRIIDEPFQFAWHQGKLYFESHVPMVPLTHAQEQEAATKALKAALASAKGVVVLDPHLVDYYLKKVIKVPTVVGYVVGKQ